MPNNPRKIRIAANTPWVHFNFLLILGSRPDPKPSISFSVYHTGNLTHPMALRRPPTKHTAQGGLFFKSPMVVAHYGWTAPALLRMVFRDPQILLPPGRLWTILAYFGPQRSKISQTDTAFGLFVAPIFELFSANFWICFGAFVDHFWICFWAIFDAIFEHILVHLCHLWTHSGFGDIIFVSVLVAFLCYACHHFGAVLAYFLFILR